MSDVFAQSLAANLASALLAMEAALADTPEHLWETDLWPDEAPTAPRPEGGLNGSAPWFLAYHALTCLDYDLTGDLEPWRPPAPFDEHVWSWPARVFTQQELLRYVELCRTRVADTLAALTDEVLAGPVAATHRHHPTPYAVLLGGLPLHVIEHAAQIRQFLTAAGVRVRPLPGDRDYQP